MSASTRASRGTGGSLAASMNSEEEAPSSLGPGRAMVLVTWLARFTDRPGVAVAIVLSFGALMLLPFLGTLGLWDCWETHYGEVAREMIVRDDYLYPHWSGGYFFSKPALPLWFMALGMLVTGAEPLTNEGPLGSAMEWGVRMPFALTAILCLWAVYRIGTLLKDRTAGVLCALVLGTSAQFLFLGKQAIMDMPLVGFMTAGFALYMVAVFEIEDGTPAKRIHRILAALGVVVAVGGQLALVVRDAYPNVFLQSGTVGVAILAVAIIVYLMRRADRRTCYLAGAYTLLGLAALSKGMAVLALGGPILLLYPLFSGDWNILRRSRPFLGALVFLLVASPWYVALTLFDGRDDEGKTFLQRFWYHDNFNRVGQGVHGDRGGLGYFVEQLAYGMFPWCAALPMALGAAARSFWVASPNELRKPVLFVVLWALWGYVFFTFSQTKFHHYTFPVLPAFAILIGVWLTWVAGDTESRLSGFVGVILLALFAVSARDLVDSPQRLVNLFTYKYDRPYPHGLHVREWIGGIIGLGGLVFGLAWWFSRRYRESLVYGLVGVSVAFGVWLSHHHFNMLSPHWSQAHLFKTYFEERVGQEPIYAYQLNWRGEDLYSRNRVIQVKDSGANVRMRELVEQPGREFVIVEQSRLHSLRDALSLEKQKKLRILDRSNNKFYLGVVEQ
jgi:4-amino-4-deoxy-L-arabinose transferase-like glycosyltransferase